MERREFLATGMVAGAAAIAAGGMAQPAAAQAKHTFKLKYAPHFGMFEKTAGEDLVDQLKFMADQGFTALEDNGLPGRSVEDQERIGKALNDLGMTMGVFVASADFKAVTFASEKQ